MMRFVSLPPFFLVGLVSSQELVNPDDWVQECFATFQENCCENDSSNTRLRYSNFYLIEEPSGLCADHLSCAFTKCDRTGLDEFDPNVSGHTPVTNSTTFEEIENAFGELALPSHISFPESVSDVVKGLKYARDNGLKVSIKSTGHSYTGSSTIKDSLQLNLRALKTYTDDGVVECKYVVNTEDPDFDACRLADARDKRALIRVGGGETWSAVYTTLMAKNNDPDTWVKYEAVGGGAGSVGAAGGWLQGGGWSYGADRLYGLGVDQVLEIEMVLADGRHVKFGPTKWEFDPESNAIYPQTKVVSGRCNDNVDAEEDEWKWVTCDDVPFADLWYAVRGGGGGTFGVLTSLKYQLHEQKPMEVVMNNSTALQAFVTAAGDNEQLLINAASTHMWFLLKMLFDPETVGIDQDTSAKCGAPSLSFNIFTGSQLIFCYDNVWSEKMLPAWRSVVDYKFEDDPIAEHLKNILGSDPIPSYPFAAMYNKMDFMPPDKVPDNPYPAFFPDKGFGGWCSAQIPAKWLGEATDENVYDTLFQTSGEHVTGANVGRASDGMSAVTPAARATGLSSPSLRHLDKTLQEQLLQAFLKEEDDAVAAFPGVTEVNHVCPDSFGPLRSDPTKLCPSDLPVEEKEKLCFSVQESIWGTETLDRLETIKAAVDPDNMFDCYPCVKPKMTSSPSSSSTSSPSSSPTKAKDSGTTTSAPSQAKSPASSQSKMNMYSVSLIIWAILNV